MLNFISSHLQGSDNFQTALIVLIYSVSAMFVMGGIGGFIRAFKKPTTINNFD